jgi:single-stranded-DNA-specific exonuclease
MNCKVQLKNINSKTFLDEYLSACGVTNIDKFKKPTLTNLESVSHYDNMANAYEILENTLRLKNPRIVIVVDIDFDGYSSASIMAQFLRSRNKNIKLDILLHKNRVHGLGDKDIMSDIFLLDPDLVICPDSSSGDYAQHKYLKEKNINCLVLDHHPVAEYSKDAVVINNQLSNKVINKGGSGALVTWKFISYFMDSKKGLTDYIDLVYFSLISDICPMNTLENRAIAHYCSNKNHIKNKLLLAMIDAYLPNGISNEDISWKLQPKLSSVIRCDDNELKESLIKALIFQDDDTIADVVKKSKTIHSRQQKIVKDSFAETDTDVDDSLNIIMEDGESISSYYRGLVGSKFTDKYSRPCILYSESKEDNTKYIGSVRSPYDLKTQLNETNLFDFAMGHECAFGVQFDKDKLEEIKKFAKNIDLDTRVKVAGEFDSGHIPSDLFNVISANSNLWGQGVDKPLFHIKNIVLNARDIQLMGRGTTFKFTSGGITFIKFFAGDKVKNEFHIGTTDKLKMDICGYFDINEWQGIKYPQIIIEKWSINDTNEITFDDLW